MGAPANLTVACVLRSGGCYTPEYVARLRAGVAAHLAGHRFVCLSDMDVPDRIPLVTRWPGWWAKLELFRLRGRVLYFDLDTVITGDLSQIAAHAHRFTMLSDFYRPQLPASGVMAWNGDYSRLFTEFELERRDDYPGWGDQGYIGWKLGQVDRFQDLFPGQVASRKATPTRNPNERVVCFHGEPRPHTVGWQV